MPPQIRHLTPAKLAERLGLVEEGEDTKAAEKLLANWRSQGRGPAYIRGESSGDKALIRYPLTEVQAWEKRRLVDPAKTT